MRKTISHQASALIIVLLLVSLVAILAVGFLTSMRTERTMAGTHYRGVQAGFFEQFSRNTALSRLELCFAEAAGKLWATQPGAFHIYKENSWETMALHSGVAAGADNNESVNINRPDLEDSNLLSIADSSLFSDGGATEMRVKWIYSNKDGTLSEAATAESVGRYAFWIDDESAKINVNTAWKSGNTSVLAFHPYQVDLLALGLSEAEVNEVANRRNAGRFFNTMEEINLVKDPESDLFDVNLDRFFLTHYNHSPVLNPFGEPKLMLTTQRARVNASDDFFDILSDESEDYVDPGIRANLDGEKVEKLVNRIAGYLRRTDWPYPEAEGKSIEEKYTPVSAVQIALNIIEYVRASESETPVVEPIRGRISAAGDFEISPNYAAQANAIMGNNRGFRTTEVALFLPADKEKTTTDGEKSYDWYILKIKREMHLPEGYGLEEVNLADYTYSYAQQGIANTERDNSGLSRPVTEAGAIIQPDQPLPLRAGEYVVVVNRARFRVNSGPNSRDALAALIRGVQLGVSRNSVDFDIVPDSSNSTSVSTGAYIAPYLVAGDSVAEADIHSYAVSDPSVNGARMAWQMVDKNTFGAPNSNVTPPALIGPEQDRDADGAISRASQRFPAPGRGGMRSVAELGRVHTGIITHDNNQTGVPFRTLRLQPRSANDTLPDWVLLDLFAVPVDASSNPLLKPAAGEGGRVNINATISPFVNAGGNPALSRALPLQAAVKERFPSPETVVTNLSGKDPAPNAGWLGEVDEPYYSTAQISEVLGISHNGEASEENLYGVVDRLTVRSGVFSIYSIGQSIQRTPTGDIRVLSEKRSKTMVEFNSSADPATWRIILTQEL